MLQLLNSTKTKMVEGRRILNDDGTATAYVVTEEGEIWSDEINNFRKLMINPNGYYVIGLALNDKYQYYAVHRFVAKYYLSNEYNHPCVNHKDCNPLNNNWRNLEWCTYEYNSQYIFENDYKEATRIFNIKLKPEQIEEICKLIDAGWRSVDIAKKFGLNKSYIANIKMGCSHRKISEKYKFSDHYKQKDSYKNRLKGNEGNHYIPPLPDDEEPVYIKTYDEVNIRKLCEMLSQKNYIASRIAAAKFHMAEVIVKQIRYGHAYQEISKDYKINNDPTTTKRVRLTDNPDLIFKILELASDGKHNPTSIATELSLHPSTVKFVIYDKYYEPYRSGYNIKLKESHKGHPLTDEIKLKTIQLLSTGELTRQQIADILDISLPSVVKIKKEAKKAGILK